MSTLTAPLVVCAAPGAGAAPVVQALAVAGLFFGDRVRGYWGPGCFEDDDLAAFHETVVAAGAPPTDVARSRSAEARALVEAKFVGRPAWGWKEPRTALLLDLWDAVVPDARWIFLYRRPAVTIWSLVRRGLFERRSASVARQAALAARTWREANRRIVAFARQHPHRCVILRTPDDLGAAGEAALRAAITRWNVGLELVALAETVRPHLLKTRAPRWVEALAAAVPGVSALTRELDGLRSVAASPADGRPVDTRPPHARPTVCVFAPTVKRELSQTFVHDHLERLPARTLLLHQEGRALLTRDDLKLTTPLERLAAASLREFGNGADAIRDRALARFLRRERVDAVLVEFADQAASVLGGAQAAGVPVIVHFHGFDAYRDAVLWEKRDDYAVLFRAAAAVIAVSQAMIEQLVRIGVPRAKIRYAPCGTDPVRFAGGDPAAAPPVFVAVGRFVEKKGPHCTLLAFRAVLDACPAAHLVMIGDGPLLGACRTLARQLGIGERVTFRGAQPQGEGLRALRGARAFVQHSLAAGGDSEGTPVAVLEASACGVPVIGTRHGGIPDVVLDGETGFLVPEGDVAAMASRMVALARDPDLAAQMGRRAQARVATEFSLERSIGRLWQVIDEAIRAAPGQPRR